jgi:putative ABC transport system substrate-binding protein
MNRCHNLAGDKLCDLPVERPSKFELAVNVETAKALDIAIAQSLRLRADEVIR